MEPLNISYRKYAYHVVLVLKLTYPLTSMTLVVQTDFSSVCITTFNGIVVTSLVIELQIPTTRPWDKK